MPSLRRAHQHHVAITLPPETVAPAIVPPGISGISNIGSIQVVDALRERNLV
jgi:hypothetical protein